MVKCRQAGRQAGVTLFRGDCLSVMKQIASGSIDMILADLPFGITSCKWDMRIPTAPLWMEYLRVLKENGPALLFATQPFATDLINAARKLFRYELIWDKKAVTGFLNVHKMPMRRHENILVFYRSLPCYNPPGLRACEKNKNGQRKTDAYGGSWKSGWVTKITGWPQSIQAFPLGGLGRQENGPATKPVELLEFLIRTYSRPGDLVLDNCMGGGNTAIAAARSGRRFIGIEKDGCRFRMAATRIVRARRRPCPRVV